MQKQKPTFKIPITEIRAWSSLYVTCNFFLKQSSLASLLNEDVAESLDIFVSVVRTPRGSVSTGVFESWPSSTKSDSGIREVAIVFLISDDSNSNSRGTVHSSLRVEPFFVTFKLQGGIGTNQRLPFIPTQRSRTVFTISNEVIQWGCCLIHLQEPGYSIPRQILVKDVLQ